MLKASTAKKMTWTQINKKLQEKEVVPEKIHRFLTRSEVDQEIRKQIRNTQLSTRERFQVEFEQDLLSESVLKTLRDDEYTIILGNVGAKSTVIVSWKAAPEEGQES